ncbi:MAG: RNA 2',3'-cyclic phosphodiesterase [Nitrospirae bacterium]|nr:RNA 2',3'-cyclic phosphodiesterase [Nitrospirota bacterium]
MRCFIAIEIDKELKREIQKIVSELKRSRAEIKWVSIEGFHLTLKFLGEIKEETAGEIEVRLREICKEHPEFSLSIKGTGVFPDYSRPRVLWIGIERSEALHRLFESIEEEMEKLGFEKETRRFNPHITIGRVKSAKGIKETIKDLRRYREHNFGKIYVTGVSLMKSILKPTGAVYETICIAPLKKEAR